MKISVVIPTRNRPDFMERVLTSLHGQTRKPDEIVVIDSSDDTTYKNKLIEKYSGIPLTWLSSAPSVCIQRNLGIRAATGDWIFLCDDDIELCSDYLEKLDEHVQRNPSCGALAGVLLQQEGTDWVSSYPVKKYRDLLWRTIFQLPIWGELENIASGPLLGVIKRFYHKRGNARTLAGWPLITQWKEPYFQTKIYSLGADVVKKQWLLNSPYDEVLDPSGIGDNYGVAMGFPGEHPIHVVTSVVAYHHRAIQNRLERPLAYYRRILALHYFLKKENSISIAWFLWSLVGNTGYALFSGNWKMVSTTLRAMGLVIVNKNPYWLGYKRNAKVVQPTL